MSLAGGVRDVPEHSVAVARAAGRPRRAGAAGLQRRETRRAPRKRQQGRAGSQQGRDSWARDSRAQEQMVIGLIGP